MFYRNINIKKNIRSIIVPLKESDDNLVTSSKHGDNVELSRVFITPSFGDNINTNHVNITNVTNSYISRQTGLCDDVNASVCNNYENRCVFNQYYHVKGNVISSNHTLINV